MSTPLTVRIGRLSTSQNGHILNGRHHLNGKPRQLQEPSGPRCKSIDLIRHPNYHRDITDRPLYSIEGCKAGELYDARVFLEDLIVENIIKRNRSNPRRGNEIARNTRAFIYSLSDDDQIRFKEITEQAVMHKDDIDKVIVGGGGFGCISTTSAVITLNTILELIGKVYATDDKGVKPMTYIATSGGAFHAMALAGRATNASIFGVTSYTDFNKFIDSPEYTQNWINTHLKRAIYEATGIKVEGNVKAEHLEMLGSNLQLVVGTKSTNQLAPFTAHLFPQGLKEIGIDPDSVPMSKLIWATINNPFIFSNHGECYLVSKGRKIYLCDPGLFQKHNVYTEPILEEIEEHHRDPNKRPSFGFVIARKVSNEDPHATTIWATTLVDRVLWGEPRTRLENAGAGRCYLETSCDAIHPTTGNSVHVDTLDFNLPTFDRELIIASNIPTSEFADGDDLKTVIAQLHENLTQNGGLGAYWRDHKNNGAAHRSSLLARFGLRAAAM